MQSVRVSLVEQCASSLTEVVLRCDLHATLAFCRRELLEMERSTAFGKRTSTILETVLSRASLMMIRKKPAMLARHSLLLFLRCLLRTTRSVLQAGAARDERNGVPPPEGDQDPRDPG
jgi:hypothetical protein